ncbi:MAG: restriction endonuclease subunit S [Thermomicrobiales bacterium]
MRLTHCASAFYAGGTPDSGIESFYEQPPDGIPWVNISDLTAQPILKSTKKHISEAGRKSKNLRLVPAGAVLYSMYASLGTVSLLLVEACINQAILGIVPDERLIRPEWLYFWLSHLRPNVTCLASSSTQANLNAAKVRSLPVLVPPLHEQDEALQFLKSAELGFARLIRNKRRLIALLNEEKQAVIQQSVTRGLDPDAPLKPSGVEWLGDIPAHWATVPLLRCISELSDYRGATPEKVDSGIQLVTAKNVRSGWIDYQVSQEFVRSEDYQTIMRRGRPNIGDLLLTMEAPLGNVALVDRTDIALAQRVVRFGLRPSSLVPQFALYATLARYFQDQLHMRATGSTALGIKASKLAQLQVFLPPIEEQEEVATYLDDRLSAIDGTVHSAHREIDLIREYRTRLIADVVTGQLDVRESQFDDDFTVKDLDLGDVELLDEADVSLEDDGEILDDETA